MNMKDNQKTIRFLHKEKCDNKNLYAIINIKAMEQAGQNLNAGAFKLWCYFAKNNSNYTYWDLSSKHIKETFGINKTQYNTAIAELITKGYLKQVESNNPVANLWDFFECPTALTIKNDKDLSQNITSLTITDDKEPMNEYQHLKDSTVDLVNDLTIKNEKDLTIKNDKSYQTLTQSLSENMIRNITNNINNINNIILPKNINCLIQNKTEQKLILKFLSQHEEWAQFNNYLVENHYDDLLERFYWSADNARASQYEDGYKTPAEYGWTIEQVNQLLGQ